MHGLQGKGNIMKECQTPTREKKNDKQNKVVVAYVPGLSEKLRRIFFKHDIPVYFRPSCSLRQRAKLPNTSRTRLSYTPTPKA